MLYDGILRLVPQALVLGEFGFDAVGPQMRLDSPHGARQHWACQGAVRCGSWLGSPGGHACGMAIGSPGLVVVRLGSAGPGKSGTGMARHDPVWLGAVPRGWAWRASIR